MRVKVSKDKDGTPIYESLVDVEIIGYTRTGRKIYLDSYDIEHALYDYDDHIDAEALHKILRNKAYTDPGIQKKVEEHNSHAHNHRRAALLSIERGFEAACLNHTTKLHRRMGQLLGHKK